MAPFAAGELEPAEERFELAVTLARRAGDRVEIAHTLLWLARIRARLNDADGGAGALATARELLPALGRSCLAWLLGPLELELVDAASTAGAVRRRSAFRCAAAGAGPDVE